MKQTDLSTYRALPPARAEKPGAPKRNPVVVADDRAAWHRQPAETANAYKAFRTWLALGPGRTLAEAGRVLGKSTSTMTTMASRHGWTNRLQEWRRDTEAESDATMTEELLALRRDQLDRGKVVEQVLETRALSILADEHTYAKDVFPTWLAVRDQNRKIAGEAERRVGAAGQTVNVNVGLAGNDPRLQAFATAIAGWAETAGLEQHQIDSLTAVITAV